MTRRLTVLIALVTIARTSLLGQCPTISPVDLGNDTTICSGELVTLNAGAGFDAYNWSTGSHASQITVGPGTYSVEIGILQDNIIFNGDFEYGDTGFSTDYIHGTGGTWGNLSTGGQYAVSTNPSFEHSNFIWCSDHTSGSGKMIVANGSWNAGDEVWSQDVNVDPNVDYRFSFWATNVVNSTNTSYLQLYINGTPIGPVNSTTTACNWLEIADVWNSGSTTIAHLSIVNQSTTPGGNDFALDDIWFAPYCQYQDEITITQQVVQQNIEFTNPLCANSNTGSISITNDLATQYSIDGGLNWSDESVFNGLSAGNYTVCSKSDLGCDVCSFVTIVEPSAPMISTSNDTLICQNGAATLQAVATGSPIFNYYWSHTSSNEGLQIVEPDEASTYNVYALNENGCSTDTSSIEVTVRNAIGGIINDAIGICPSEIATLQASAFGGIGPYSFEWSTDSLVTNVNITSLNVSPEVTTTYTVEIKDKCESTPILMVTEVEVYPLPQPTFEVEDSTLCYPEAFNLMSTTVPVPSSLLWQIDEHYFMNQESVTVGDLAPGNYSVYMQAISDKGCVNDALVENALTVYALPVANFKWSPNPVLMFNTEVKLANISTFGVNYEWYMPDANPSFSYLEEPTIYFPDGETGAYDVQLIAFNEFGCSDTIQQVITVSEEVIVYVPNAFTPDGDEYNNNWGVNVLGIDIKDFNLVVYNRWGELVWESHDAAETWDGTYNGVEVPNGIYTWSMEVKDLHNDERQVFQGHVNVLK